MKRTHIRRKAHKDPVTPELRAEVAERDGRCVLSKLDPTHTCRDTWGNQIDPRGVFEIDHVMNSGVGMRGPSVRSNLVRLCPWGHAEKTNNARRLRPYLVAYLESVEGKAA
jgi:hypothetical protein